ncbi:MULTISPECIES: transketolase [Achromobacter]|uniref:Transketolase n=1 Tax=Alcaligenes xylosoxydans xylosoxydans TaxID=85698 RepID=A0A424WDB8_ALCXX|nr:MULTISPECIES: transketolase [Achromobacter]MBC9906208.1 transketolase [Achromobacter xylosoxidans]MBD0870030.1 transketolase [Achromobacter xylosoxidans]MDH1302627.1 transketolase [Achromobacter sp. GD03932]QNP87216.1 transketolase [Achromobacter xylosoxidans]RPJ91236.1 transketolase [Achromobacter xylosoxidans]
MSNPTAPKLALADAIRALAMDAVQQANSGHPGAPMGMAEIAQALWAGNLRHNPKDPAWANRDRFVLSNGHGSMLIYALLHLTGYDLPIEELKNFRQLHSKTPGHPEVGITPGVETTTGPLGQGLGNAVGMALAEALLAAEFNKPGHAIVDHHTYAFTGDGCLMEGISHEVCSLAGTLKLGKLVVLYDDNGISIDGHVEHWFADDTAKRFEGYGWNVIRGIDGHDVAAVDAAIKAARSQSEKPTLIVCRTVIGKGSPNMAGTHNVHGAPLGKDEIAATRAALGWSSEPFQIPQDIYDGWDGRKQGAAAQAEWQSAFDAYAAEFPAEAAEFKRRMKGEMPAGYAEQFKAFLDATLEKAETVATRKASQFAITALAPLLPEMLGGSADLTGSNFTDWKGVAAVRAGDKGIQFGRHINYGVREFGMAAIMNGVALHGGYLPFGGTFLTFSDYSRNAIRMAALMKQRVVHVFTHDSIGLGEDGPTHQSIEHAASLRLIPNLSLWRPCDTAETAVAWNAAVTRPTSIGMDVHDGGPTALLLSRQNLPFVPRDAATVDAIARGGYVLRDAEGARAVIIATGSEVAIALDAQAQLAKEGIAVRVVSMPSTDVFDRQDAAWKQSVLPKGLPRVAVEAGVTAFWHKYVGLEGAVVGIDRYGESAPAGALFKFFGLTADKVAETVKQVL